MSKLAEFCENNHLKEALVLKLKDGRLPHAVLLEGPRGCGKRTFARLMAAALICSGTDRPCGECLGCRKVEKNIHPDVVLLGEGKGSFKVEEIRALKAGVYVRPNEAACKVYILCDVQNMTPQAQNALLKVLEEPPANVQFILTCTSAAGLLPTTLSRVMLWKVDLLSREGCAQELGRRMAGLSPETCRAAAEAFSGNLGQALESLQGEQLPRFIGAADELFRALRERREFDMLQLLGEFENDRDGLRLMLERLRGEVHAALKEKYVGGIGGSFSALQCCRIVDIIEQCESYLTQNMGYPLVSAWLCARLRAALE